jgi:hypothetical protein
VRVVQALAFVCFAVVARNAKNSYSSSAALVEGYGVLLWLHAVVMICQWNGMMLLAGLERRCREKV